MILSFPHQNVGSAYQLSSLRANQFNLKSLGLDVPLSFLYPYVGKPDKNHQQTIEIHYPQPVECR